MEQKPKPEDFTHNGVLQQPHYDNAVRAWEKMEGMEVEEIYINRCKIELFVEHYFVLPGTISENHKIVTEAH